MAVQDLVFVEIAGLQTLSVLVRVAQLDMDTGKLSTIAVA